MRIFGTFLTSECIRIFIHGNLSIQNIRDILCLCLDIHFVFTGDLIPLWKSCKILTFTQSILCVNINLHLICYSLYFQWMKVHHKKHKHFNSTAAYRDFLSLSIISCLHTLWLFHNYFPAVDHFASCLNIKQT